MQPQSSVSSTINNMVAGLGTTNIIQIQPANQSQPSTQYVTLDTNNRAQIINLPTQQTGQYIAVQPGSFQVIPIQGANTSTQYVQLQIPNLQQTGANFIQLQAPTNQSTKNIVSVNANLNQQGFIPVQPTVNQSQIGNIDNQRVSIQLVQHPTNSPKRINIGPSLVGTRTSGESTSAVLINEPIIQQPNANTSILSEEQTVNNIPTQTSVVSPSRNATSTTSTLFQALQQAAAIQQQPQPTNTINQPIILNANTLLQKNVVTKTYSVSKLPQTNLDQIKPNVRTITVSASNKNENKPIKAGTIVVVSAPNQQSQSIGLQKSQQNPVFVPITMANNVSVLTNQAPAVLASKRLGQAPQAIPIRIQQQIAPRVSNTEGQSNLNSTAQTPQPKFLIPVQSSTLQNHQQNQQQILIQPNNIVRIASQIVPQIQQKKDNLANIVPGPKPVVPQPTANSSSAQESKPFKKPCNCTKSQCLKLYCECFANGEFCNNCNCRMCLNNIEHDVERSKAIKNCLERNPHAFHPKIGKGKVKGDNERRHTKGCNCKRSGCLKNYCECYEAKILCSSLCRCNGCKNFEESDDRKTLMQLADAAEARVLQQNAAKSKLESQILPKKASNTVKDRFPLNFDVSKATCDVLLATAVKAEKNQLSETEAERSLVIEFSRCLDQIIETSNKTCKGKR